MEAELAKAECGASSCEKILAAYAKAPDCEAVRETLLREKEKLLISLKTIRRILSELHRSSREELGRLRDENEELKSKNRKLLIELRDSLGVNSALKDKDGHETEPAQVQHGSPPEKTVRPRGAPKGHRGNTRSIPDKWDEKIEVPPPGVCECGWPGRGTRRKSLRTSCHAPASRSQLSQAEHLLHRNAWNTAQPLWRIRSGEQAHG